MARAFILSPRLSDRGSITASTAVSGAVAGNLLLPRPRSFWRSTNASPFVEENLGAQRVLDTLVIGFTNGKTSGATTDTFRLRVDAASQAGVTASPDYDSGDQPIWPVGSDLSAFLTVHRVFTFPQVTAQYLRVDFNFPASSGGYVQAARLMVGKRIEPATSAEAGWSIGGSEDVVETVDMGGEESPRSMGVKRSQTVTWNNLLESERDLIYAALLERGSSRDLTLAIEGSEGVYSMSRVHIGRVKQAFSFAHKMKAGDKIQRYSLSVTVNEMAPVEMS